MAHRPLSLTRGRPLFGQALVSVRPGAPAIEALVAVLAALLVSCMAPFALAQVAPGAAPPATSAAYAALSDALNSGEDPHPDQPSWQAAYEAADLAVESARGLETEELREALRLSAHVYAHINWYSRAFSAFDQFLAEGGELGREPYQPPGGGPPLASDMQAFVTSANQLGFARYQAGDMDGAVGYYLTVLDLYPDEPEALRWIGRIGFERGDEAGAQTAVNAFGSLLELDPSDEAARYFHDLSRERLAIGVAASDAFRHGVALYEQGDLEGALERFEAAANAAPEYVEASVWAGRTALELGQPQLAVGYWQQVVDARPDDAGAAWFLGVARAQVRWGIEAARAYYDGLAAYEAGDLASASDSFVLAAEANPEFVDAWVWAARSLQENGEPLASIPYWERVIELDPDDERADWYLRRARTAIERGEIAGPAYFDAAAAYQVGDAEGALALLETALAQNPDFALAWGLKGRIAFQLGRYEMAAEAYGEAAELEPGNGDYAFFADEARMLSGEADDDAGPAEEHEGAE